jgi:hypothetical protein
MDELRSLIRFLADRRLGMVWLPDSDSSLNPLESLYLSLAYVLAVSASRNEVYTLAFRRVSVMTAAYPDLSSLCADFAFQHAVHVIIFDSAGNTVCEHGREHPIMAHSALLPSGHYTPVLNMNMALNTDVEFASYEADRLLLRAIRERLPRESGLRPFTEELPPVDIGFLGASQSGKSSLINFLLGGDGFRLLPVGGKAGPCTSFPIRLQKSSSTGYKFTFTFKSLRELDLIESDVDVLRALFGPRPTGYEGLLDFIGQDPSDDVRMRRLYDSLPDVVRGTIELNTFTIRDLDISTSRRILQRFVGQPKLQEAHYETLETIEAWVTRMVQTEFNPLWVLIKMVDISGPFVDLPRDVRLVDLPGLNDANVHRTNHTLRVLSECDRLILAARYDSGLMMGHDQPILRTLFQDQTNPSSIIICATCVDNQHRVDEVLRNFEDDGVMDVSPDSVATYLSSQDCISSFSRSLALSGAADFEFLRAVPIVPLSTVKARDAYPAWSCGIITLRSMLYSHSFTVYNDIRVKLHEIERLLRRDLAEGVETELQIAVSALRARIPVAGGLAAIANNFATNSAGHLDAIRRRGDWDDCNIVRSKKYSDRSSLSCAVRDYGVFTSESRYQRRKRINLVEDFVGYFQNLLAQELAADCLSFAEFVADCRATMRLNPHPASANVTRVLINNQHMLVSQFALHDLVRRNLDLGYMLDPEDALDHLLRNGDAAVLCCGVHVIDAIEQRRQEVDDALRQLSGGPPVPDPLDLELLNFIVEHRRANPEPLHLCLECDDLVPCSLLFHVCPRHRVCNEIAETMIKSKIANGGMGDFPPRCNYCNGAEPDNFLSPEYIAEHQVLLHLSDDEVKRYLNFYRRAMFAHPVACRECGDVFDDADERHGDGRRAQDTVTTDTLHCPYCDSVSCAICNLRPPHPDRTCRSFAVQAEDAAAEALIDRISRPCPRCGRRNVHSRNHGCHHIGYATRGCQGIFEGRQCGFHYCCVCFREWRTCRCPSNCDATCGCPDCFECRPGRPCRYA